VQWTVIRPKQSEGLPQPSVNCYHYHAFRGLIELPLGLSTLNEVARVDSTRNLVLSLFPAQVHANRSLQTLADLLEVFTRAGTLRARLDALVELHSWLRRKDHRLPELSPATGSFAGTGPEWRRERVWLAILESSPTLRDRYHAGIASILEETDAISLFAQAGLPTDRGLIPETFDRFFRIVLPAPREETELAKLLVRLFPTQKEVERFFSQTPDQLKELATQITPVEIPEAWEKPLAALRDAFYLLAARAQGLGLSENLRIRGQGGPVQQSPFHHLMLTTNALLEAVLDKQGAADAAQNWKAAVAACRAELQAIVTHLDTRGVNLDVVYAMDVIEQSLKRMELVCGVLVALPGPPKMVTSLRLLRDVIRGRVHDRSLRGLAQNSFRLLAKKIVEWAGKTGEHYVTNNREEYRQMWYAALGGGLLTVGTAAIKLMVTHRGLPPFVEGFLAGLNYAVSFVLMHIFHLALATKQPSMTGAALASILHRCQDSSRIDELVSYVQRIVRSQLAAAFGNIIAVGAGAVVFSLIWKMTFGSPFLDVETAEYTVKSMNPIHSGTLFFAILTGVILWLSSLAGGWIENWAVYHQLPRAIAEHHLGASFKPETIQKFSESFAQNIAPWGGSIVLGFMLGMTPSIGHFFGLPLDVRHVTLSTGTLALGITSRGPEVLGRGALIWASLGIAVTFLMNLGVSFYLALRLALRAQDISPSENHVMLLTLGRRFWAAPREFFLPPGRVPTPTAEPAP
jgi:site-specific recombinase